MKTPNPLHVLVLAGCVTSLTACAGRERAPSVVTPDPKAAHAPSAVKTSLAVATSPRPGLRPAEGETSVAQANESRIPIYLTGYSYWSNTPPGSAAIARPVIHHQAGGTGTYANPITIAVGHSIIGARQILDFPQGTRFYLPNLRKYAIVEDVCGDGPRPQNEACHIGYNGLPWLDLYVDGKKAGKSASYACAVKITSIMDAVVNPAPDYPVHAGALTEGGCATFDGRGSADQRVAGLGQ